MRLWLRARMSDSAESRSHPILGDPGAVSWVGRKSERKFSSTYMKTFVPPFLTTRLPLGLRGWSHSRFSQKLCNISLAYPRSFTSQKGSCILIAFSHVFAGIVRVQKNFMAPKWRYVFWCHAPENESTILRTSITIYPVVRKQRLSIIKHTVINFTNEPITWILSR